MTIHKGQLMLSLLVCSLVFSDWGRTELWTRVEAREQAPGTVGTREYVKLVREYRSGKSSDAIRELASWESHVIRNAVQDSVKRIHELSVWFKDLSALDARWRNGELDQQKYAVLRSAVLKKIERVYQNMGDDHILKGDSLGRDVQDLPRGAVGLHTAVAARSWRAGTGSAVADHVEFAMAYFPDLLATREQAYTGVWCRVAGTLLTASDRFGDALRAYERCLQWQPRDVWLLLGRGSAFESAAMLSAALPPNATLVHGPDALRDTTHLMEQAVAAYEAALEEAPDLAEARIRLARLRIESGNADAGAMELSKVHRPDLVNVLNYWASLFAGSAEERRGDAQAAAGHYRVALRLYPRAQAAALGLTRVLVEGLGNRAEALTVLINSTEPSVMRTFSDDPWWFYRMGQAWRASEWLDEVDRWSRF